MGPGRALEEKLVIGIGICAPVHVAHLFQFFYLFFDRGKEDSVTAISITACL